MKKHQLFPASFLLVVLLNWGCNGDSALTITYPRAFVLSGYEMGQVQYNVVTANGYSTIQNYPLAAQVENGIRAELDEWWHENELNIIEFISETEALAYGLDADSNLFSVPVAVHAEGNDLTLDFGGGYEVELTQNDDFTELRMCNISYYYSYYNTLADRVDFSPAYFTTCYTDDMNIVQNDIVNEHGLIVGDTIILHLLDYIYDMQ